MIIDILSKLIDRFIQLEKQRREERKLLYDQIVAPIESELESIHSGYIESFRKYKEIIRQNEIRFDMFHPLFECVPEDSLYSSTERNKIWQLYSKMEKMKFPSLADAIKNYIFFDDFLFNEAFKHGFISPVCNRYRLAYVDLLEKVAKSNKNENDKKEIALKCTDLLAGSLHAKYAVVSNEIIDTRIKLLVPKNIG